MKTIEVQTEAKTQVINITEELAELVKEVKDGLAFFFVPHTTAALLICEDDEGLRDDLVKVAENWLVDLQPFTHIRRDNPNTEAHVLSAFGGTSVTLAIEEGRLELGNYQNVLLLELDGPKKRTISCKILSSVGV
jgi:secondary thiamine-phosphate synthase enzyme